VLTGERGTVVVAVGFVSAIAIAAVLLFTGTGESADLNWTKGRAVPGMLSPGATVVDDAIPVEVGPDVQTWTGRELLTFGTRGSANVGAVYEPSTGRWRAMSAVPFGTALRGAAAVWTGEFWVVVGVLCRSDRPPCNGSVAAAAYEPDTDSWTAIDANPQPAAANGRGHEPVIGRGVGMLGSDAAFVLDGQYYAFRPDSWDWDWLPAPPPSDGAACTIDGDVVVADVETSTVSVLEPGASAWDVVRAPDHVIESATAETVCTDASLVAFAPDLSSVAVFDVAARRWSEIAPPPFPTTGPLVGAFTGGVVLFSRPEETVTYGPHTGAWGPAPPGITATPERVAWTEQRYGLFVVDGETLVAYDPGV
jgi:hypothetical protein